MSKYKYGDIKVYAKSYLNSVLYTKPKTRLGGGLLRACSRAVKSSLTALGAAVAAPFTLLVNRKKAREDRYFGPTGPFYRPVDTVTFEGGDTVVVAPEARAVGTRWIWALMSSLLAGAGLVAMLSATAAGHAAPIYSVTIFQQGLSPTHLTTRADTVAAALAEAGVSLAEADEVQPAPDAALEDVNSIYIKRANTVYVVCGQDYQELTLAGGTVREALAEAGVTYDEDDLVQPAAYTPLESGMRIHVTRVEVELITAEEAIPYQTIQTTDGSLEKGKVVISRAGEAGLAARTYRVTTHDGEETARELLGEELRKEPVDQREIVGTKILDPVVPVAAQVKLQNDDRADRRAPRESEIQKTLYLEVTAYTHTGEPTACGNMPKLGTIAVNPEQIPYGTKLYVEGYGYGVAEDTGAFRHTDRFQIDLFMDTVKECRTWGRQRNVRVFILK